MTDKNPYLSSDDENMPDNVSDDDSTLMDGSLNDEEVRVDDDKYFADAIGEREDIIGENAPTTGLAGLSFDNNKNDNAGVADKPAKKIGLPKRKPKENASVDDESKSEKVAKPHKKFALPKLGRRHGKSDEVLDSGFALGSSSGGKNDPFSDAFSITDEDEDGIKILSDKERKRRAKKKNPLTLGQKYGGQRKVFAALGLLLVFNLLFGALNFMLLQGKASNDNVAGMVKEEVENSTASSFPVGQAGMWMESFIRIYGTWDYKTPAGRAADLSPYLAPGLDAQAGWNGQGTQKVIYSAVSSAPKIVDKSRAVFDVTYQIQDGTWRCAQVPIFAYKPTSKAEGPTNQWGFAVTSNPVPMPCALRISVPEFKPNTFDNTDTAAATTLQDNFFPGFFTAWVTSDADTLQQYMGPNIKTFGLGGAYQANPEVTTVQLPIGPEEEKAANNTIYSAYVTVVLTDRQGARLTTTYKIPVALNSGSQWQVMGEPEPVIQGTEVGTSGNLPENPGKDSTDSEDDNEYSEPDNPGNQQPADSQPTAPAPSSGG